MQVSGKRLRPEIKIILYILFSVSLFIFEDVRVYLCFLAVACLFLSRIPFAKLKAGWIPITIFLTFTFFSNVLNTHGRILVSSFAGVITAEGLDSAVLRTLRLLLMIGGAKILMTSSSPDDIVGGLGRLFAPFEKIGLPVKDFFHTMGLTVKCFPVLKDMVGETYRTNTQVSAAGSFSEKARAVSSFLMPMFVKSIQSPEIFFERPETHAK